MKNYGKRAETLAAWFLILRGYKILERNYHSRFGEIDIIAKKDGVTEFVEVKARSGKMLGTPANAVDIYKQQKIIKTAYRYLLRCPDTECRFDVVEVVTRGLRVTVNHIKNAFEL